MYKSYLVPQGFYEVLVKIFIEDASSRTENELNNTILFYEKHVSYYYLVLINRNLKSVN